MANDFTLSFGDILKDAHHIHEYRGDNSRALSSFIREVDMIFSLLPPTSPAGVYVFRRVILNKVQGEALHVVRTIENSEPSWNDIKTILIRNFGIKESYNQLYQEAFMLSNKNNITEYFKSLRSIMCKINEKYEYDNVKRPEFSPKNVEETMLRTFLKNIDVNLASVVINRNVKNLREAFDLLETEGLIRNPKQTFSQSNEKSNKTENQNYQYQNNNTYNQKDRFYKPNHNNQDHNAKHNNNFQNVKANSGNFRSGTQNLNSNQDYTNQQSHVSKMEIDHAEVNRANCSQFKNDNQNQSITHESEQKNCSCHANFHTIASKNHFL